MVDAYPTNEGDWILDLSRPYLNVEHTQPNLNPNAKDSKNEAYSESDPYSCFRDPRFYASIYYHGSKRYTRWSFAEGEYAVNTFRAREIDCSQTDPWTQGVHDEQAAAHAHRLLLAKIPEPNQKPNFTTQRRPRLQTFPLRRDHPELCRSSG